MFIMFLAWLQNKKKAARHGDCGFIFSDFFEIIF